MKSLSTEQFTACEQSEQVKHLEALANISIRKLFRSSEQFDQRKPFLCREWETFRIRPNSCLVDLAKIEILESEFFQTFF